MLLEKKRKKLCLRASSSRNAAREEKKKDKVRGRFWNETESRGKKKKKKGEDGDNGYTCVVEKNQEKRKRKGNIWMIERKEGKIQFRNATTINFK